MRKPVTIRTLANELGLSVSAVSKALNDYPDIGTETKTLVQHKAEELGYTPNILARNLAKKTSPFVGVVIRDVSSVYGEMFKSLSEVARRCGLHLILYDTNNDPAVEKWCVQNLIDSMAMGIVIVPVSEDVGEICAMAKGRVPVVFLGGKVRDNTFNYVCADSKAGTELAMGHLIGLGHKRIAMVCDYKQSNSRSTKLEVYRQMMRGLGQEELVYYGCNTDTDILVSGYVQGKRILASKADVTAVFVVKDLMAIGVIKAFIEAGKRVPEDISVVGYDGIDAAALPMIELTTVAQPRLEMAEQIIDILHRHADDPSMPSEHYLARPELVERKSSASSARAMERMVPAVTAIQDFRQGILFK